MFRADDELKDLAVDLLQRLLRIDTTNPPGNERVAADLVAAELADAGLEPAVLESAPGRGNVIARLKAKQPDNPPLLLASHLDVVPAEASEWTHPPFSGAIADGFVWGRGAVDMKNFTAMSLALICRLARQQVPLDRDLIFAAVADEEAGCEFGSRWLCANHPELVRAEFGLGEGGGFNLNLAGRRYYTVEVAEKGVCWVRARVRGTPGHGAMPRSDSAVLTLSAALTRLRKRGLPFHTTPVLKDFVAGIGKALPAPLRPLLGGILHPQIAGRLLRHAKDSSVTLGLKAMMGNTASPTVLRAGSKTNVIPSTAEVEIDGRLLPGQTTDDFLRELGAVLGSEVELEVLHACPPVVTEPRESKLYTTIFEVLREKDPDATPIPYLLPGFTDASAFAQIGVRWYGFSPVRLDEGLRFADLFHGIDERIPIDGLRWGTEVLAEVVTRFAGRP